MSVGHLSQRSYFAFISTLIPFLISLQPLSDSSEMRDFLSLSSDLMTTLSDTSRGPLTAFFVSDAAVNRLPDDMRLYLQHNNHVVLEVSVCN